MAIDLARIALILIRDSFCVMLSPGDIIRMDGDPIRKIRDLIWFVSEYIGDPLFDIMADRIVISIKIEPFRMASEPVRIAFGEKWIPYAGNQIIQSESLKLMNT